MDNYITIISVNALYINTQLL